MKIYKFFLYWILTILVGSFLLILSDVFFFNGAKYTENITVHLLKGTLGFSFLASTFSIPSMIILFILNSLYRRNDGFTASMVLRGKLIIMTITYAVMFIAFGGFDTFSVSLIVYGIIGYFFWWREFKIMASKSS